MPIRVDRVKVDREGPLKEDFDLEATDLNLVYGPNESGKTYIVEFMLKALFKTGVRSPGEWSLREWHPRGKIVVSGLENGQSSFTVSGKKLESYWEESASELPCDFSRLVVVMEGESRLTDTSDGVGQDILKDYLSGERVLDTIEDRIPKTVRKATIEQSRIAGDRKGDVSQQAELRQELQAIDDLLDNVNSDSAAGTIQSLKRERQKNEIGLEGLTMARRHHAAKLDQKLQELRSKTARLPDEDKLNGLDTQIGIYNREEPICGEKRAELKNLQTSSEEYSWASSALNNYQEIMRNLAEAKRSPVFLMIAVALLVAALTFGVMGQQIGLVLSGVGVLVSMLIDHFRVRASSSAGAGDSEELQKLSEAFKSRFDQELTDRAAIDAQLRRLERDYNRADDLEKELAKLEPGVKALKRTISSALRSYVGEDVSPTEWDEKVRTLRDTLRLARQEEEQTERQLEKLGVFPDQYLADQPEVVWDPSEYKKLEDAIDRIDGEVGEEEVEHRELKSRVAQEAKCDATDSWENLLTALQQKREQKANEYRVKTAQILAGTQVYAALGELRKHETERIREGLKRLEVTDPLLEVTGRYKAIDVDEGGLILTDQDDESFRLEDLSTGAREQVFLALRIGFASIAMQGEKGFLILDDAFQHSDWDRRKNLVNKAMSVVKAGWQVFYFTMDDHIRDLFKARENELGGRFAYTELA